MTTTGTYSGAPAQEHSALFANLVLQQSNMALMLLGKLENPAGEEPMPVDPEGASFFIDQLAMLETKTKGNLTPEEADLLKQTLLVLRMTYVEVTNRGGEPTAEKKEKAAAEVSSDAASEENRTKFSKKY